MQELSIYRGLNIMKSRGYIKRALEECRIAIYVSFTLSALLYSYVLPVHDQCELGNTTCMMCGMRHAIYYLIHLEPSRAFQCNKLIVVLVFIIVIMLIDILHIIRRNKAENC